MKGRKHAVGSSAAVLGMFVAALATLAVLAPGAGAVLVHVGNGQVAGVTPVKGVSPASIPGSYAKRRGVSPFSTADNLNYHSGAVLHGEAPYLIFWDPGSQISSLDKALYERFFADGAADSGAATNVYGVDRQFTDTTGFADYSQTWSVSHAITDTQAYPSTGQCTENNGFTETACLFDGQIQAEVARLVAADSLPTGIGGNAPIYFVVTPPTVNSCFSDNSTCADNFFCAYHSSFTDASSTVLYTDMATILDANDPKGCQADGNSAVQEPNGRPIADVMIKAMSHEYDETITDPVNGGGWYNTSSGQEDGDQCNFFGAYNPAQDSNPNAFLPTLGGSAGSGTLFNQVMNGNDYYTQSEWSNGDGNCEMRPTTSAISAAFSAPATGAPSTSISFNPSTSSSAGGYTSTTWSWGDGNTSFSRAAPTTISHSFAVAGTYTVTLTLVDIFGNVSTVSHSIDISSGPVASFTFSPPHPQVNTSVSVDGSGSTDNGGTITSYTWDWGDGSATSTGVTQSHTYTSPGTYTITLTVSDGTNSANTTHSVKVDAVPVASFSVSTAHPIAGSSVAFTGAASNEPGGSIASYSWNFGDGSTAGTGATPSHTYASSGMYTVGLTVTDQDGYTATVSHTVNVGVGPLAAFTSSPPHPLSGTSVAFDGSGSTDDVGTISSYTWDFGDGSAAGTGVTPSHTYAASGTYTVKLTVSDGTYSNSITHTVSVHGAPAAAFSVAPAHPSAGSATSFNGSASGESGGTIASYSWTFGDGASGTGVSPSHVYSKAGSYSVSLTVTDGFGGTASTSKTVVVSGVPMAKLTVKTAHPVVGGTTAFSGASSTDIGSTITSYKWTFGDGSNGSGASVTHKYTKAGKFNVTLTITDASGAGSAVATTVTVKKAGIASVTIKTGKNGAQVKFALGAAGTLKVGSQKFKIKHAGSFKLKYKLSKSQLKKLHSHHSLTIKLKATFTPKGGKPSSRTITIKIKG